MPARCFQQPGQPWLTGARQARSGNRLEWRRVVVTQRMQLLHQVDQITATVEILQGDPTEGHPLIEILALTQDTSRFEATPIHRLVDLFTL